MLKFTKVELLHWILWAQWFVDLSPEQLFNKGEKEKHIEILGVYQMQNWKLIFKV